MVVTMGRHAGKSILAEGIKRKLEETIRAPLTLTEELQKEEQNKMKTKNFLRKI
ncbi:hypothetical protein [Macrococcus brunensis]|uniref:hypothetical protein n=1 Tax=Macrococcus brunensis TaxID=198483 RepID=UPI001408B4CF|nr:hypothetical protein [Macrococcus brunensis]